jgi:Ca-activated chloride channel family protein
VAEYRLIGYEKRILKREDFNNDKVDAGDINSGHTVTAIYEIALVGSAGTVLPDELRYGDGKIVRQGEDSSSHTDEYAFLKIRYKLPDEDQSRLLSKPITVANDVQKMEESLDPSMRTVVKEFRFASAVASFAQLLKGSDGTGDFGYEDILALAEETAGEDPYGYRKEFLTLVRTAKRLVQESSHQ